MLKHMKKSTNVKLTGFLCAAAFMATGIVNAQEPANYGRLSGSFETNTIWYMPDSLVYNNGNPMPADRIGSNNYLKLDYTLGKFSAGVQGELYAPVLSGYQEQYKGGKITNKYASWTDDNFFVTVGDFYDQYGSGLIFRAYEDRALGMNSAVEGVRAGMNIGDAFAIRAMLRPRGSIWTMRRRGSGVPTLRWRSRRSSASSRSTSPSREVSCRSMMPRGST